MKKNGDRWIIYHGSEFVIERPAFGVGKIHNDYGPGFYCTFERDMAMEWAVTEAHDGYANRYELEVSGLKVLDLSKAPFNTMHWLSVLLRNRTFDMDGSVMESAAEYLAQNFAVDYSAVDVMLGYRADDNYFAFAKGFLNGSLSYQQLNRAIRLGGLGMQVVLISPTAFGRLVHLGSERASRAQYLGVRQTREQTARSEFAGIRSRGLRPEALYMIDVIRQRMKGDDARLS